ncbi:MAG TPA: amidohydrolase family protein [Tabrizicola sp.]|nr:amidohydrolase family protein [Tabrizicola sp.]
MPTFPLIDSHLHLWDPQRLTYHWLFPPLDRPFLPADFRAASAGVEIEALVFLECDATIDQAEAEARQVLLWAKEEPRIAAMVCNAPLERGDAARAELERLAAIPKVRGVRRIYQDQPDVTYCLRPDFVTGVRALADYGFSFDLCLKHPHLQATIGLADACPNVPMVLDHIAKPGIAAGLMQPWADQMRDLARRENVVCKLSGVATEAGPDWTPATLRPYIDVALESFGPSRIMFGGDWPVSTLRITYPAWVAVVEDAIADLSETEQRQIFRATARAFYRL